MNAVILNDDYIYSEIESLNSRGRKELFNTWELGDAMVQFIYSDYDQFRSWAVSDPDPAGDPLADYCEEHIFDYVRFLCFKYCCLSFVLEDDCFKKKAF